MQTVGCTSNDVSCSKSPTKFDVCDLMLCATIEKSLPKNFPSFRKREYALEITIQNCSKSILECVELSVGLGKFLECDDNATVSPGVITGGKICDGEFRDDWTGLDPHVHLVKRNWKIFPGSTQLWLRYEREVPENFTFYEFPVVVELHFLIKKDAYVASKHSKCVSVCIDPLCL